jgi:hypothetical protein
VEHVRGAVVHCSRFGCVVRLDDGRLASLPSSERGVDVIKRALGAGRRPQFPFLIQEAHGRRIRLSLATPSEAHDTDTGFGEPTAAMSPIAPRGPARFSSSLEQKIIDFWRQVSDWDHSAGRVDEEEPPLRRADRLRPFEERTRTRDTKKRPRRRP